MGQSNRRKKLSVRWRAKRSWRLALFIVPCLLAATSAHAASRQAQERKAHKACLSGDYAKGVSILSDLFVDSNDPTYVFNQGRCFEQNRRYEDAIARFQEYLRAGTNLTPSDKALTEKHIADCQDLLTKQSGQPAATVATAPPVQAPIVLQPPAAPPPGVTPPPAVVAQQIQPQSANTPGSGLRTTGIVTASVGGAAVIAGVIFNLKVNSMASDMQNTPGGYSSGKESDRKTYAALGWVSYGVGAACVATGAILYILGLKAGPSSSASVALAPAFSPSQVGAMLKGAF